uniref:Anaphase-promoting complex subunit 5 n=1 Tax=Syphacia muris TaxID=451379 RepID=A0A0N5AJZ5_9BILA
MALPLERLNLDDAFAFLYEKSVYEPVPPFHLAIYLLTRTLTAVLKEQVRKEDVLKQKDLVEISFIIYTMLSLSSLSYPEFCWMIYEPLNRFHHSLYPRFLKSLNEYCGTIEMLVQKDEVLAHEISIRRRRLLRFYGQQNFATRDSVVGIFIRKLALARSRQSISDLHRSHDCWLKWLLDKKPSNQKDLLGNCNSTFYFNSECLNTLQGVVDDASLLTPRVKDICLTAGSSANDRHIVAVVTSTNNNALKTSGEADKSSHNEEGLLSSGSNIFRCEVFAPTVSSSFGSQLSDNVPEAVANELLSSARARAFMERQIHLLHVAPEEAMQSVELKAACNFIRRVYCDLPLVHLVLMLNALRNRNPVEAEEALRSFFDCGTIRVNERDSAGEIHFTACDARPLRYAPLLLARLARLFNQRQRARHLLTEAIQHAHSNRDLVCLRLAVVEQAAIEAEEDLADQQCAETNEALSPTHLLSMWSIRSTESGANDDIEQENEMFYDEEKDAKAFSKQLSDCATLQECIIQSKKCTDLLQVVNGLQVCGGADYGADRASQSRLMNDTAHAIAASLKLASGFVDAAVSDCQTLLQYNSGDSLCRRYNTEAHVIASVNIIYANAMNGKFSTAICMLQKLKQRFSMEANQQVTLKFFFACEIKTICSTDFKSWCKSDCALHWKKCESLIGFDQAFLLGKWCEAAHWLEIMSCLAPEEADLRKAVYFFTRGNLSKAFNVIRARSRVAANSNDFRLKIRCNMVLAMFYASDGREHVAKRILEDCLQQTGLREVDNIEAMILRRLAYMIEENYDEALEKINRCEWTINTRCSFLEKAHFAVTKYLIMKRRLKFIDTNEDSRLLLSYLATAKNFYRHASAPLLEKNVLRLAANEYNDLKEIECRDDCAVMLVEMEEKCPGNLNWEIL